MATASSIPGTVLLLQVYTQLAKELDSTVTTKWLAALTESWSYADMADLLLQLFTADRFTHHLEHCLPKLLHHLDQQPRRKHHCHDDNANLLPSVRLALNTLNNTTAQRRSSALASIDKLSEIACCTIAEHGQSITLHGLQSLLSQLHLDATEAILKHLMLTGRTSLALTMAQLTPCACSFSASLTMASTLMLYIDSNVVLDAVSCCCHRNVNSRERTLLSECSGGLVCSMSHDCLQRLDQLAVALEMGCLATQWLPCAHEQRTMALVTGSPYRQPSVTSGLTPMTENMTIGGGMGGERFPASPRATSSTLTIQPPTPAYDSCSPLVLAPRMRCLASPASDISDYGE
eukprot:TRINITY_DN7301_c0_g1_i1.p1 TRINITY_DN7301_c0_g1~~TRINITY_DN7301_c0_g1_i1.p1  ORF type:complete len:347 (+),score=39.57 TRINITY_DN7301_c0_g1_i1:205-1245(+)